MSEQQPTGVAWRKSRHSNPNGACVELARLADGRVAIRDSKDPEGARLYYGAAEVATLLAAVKAGEFDDLLA